MTATASTMTRPAALAKDEPLLWSAGTGTDVWAMFSAAVAGDLDAIRRLLTKDPALVRAQYAYRTPLYFAVREDRVAGHAGDDAEQGFERDRAGRAPIGRRP